MFTKLEMQSHFNTLAVEQGLKATVEGLCSAFAKKRIIVLRYRNVPILHEKDLFEALTDQIKMRSSGEHLYRMFCVSGPTELQAVSSSIARALVEVRGRLRAFLTMPEELWSSFRQMPSFRLWQGYTHILGKIDDNPISFLTLMSGIDDFPVYTERRLPELSFAAAIAQLDNPLTQEELEGLLSCIRTSYAKEGNYNYISWDRRQILGPLLQSYFESLGLVGPARDFAEEDRKFYLMWCFRRFSSAGQTDCFVKYCQDFSDEDAYDAKLLQRLEGRCSQTSRWNNAISFLFFLAGSYLLAESTAPTQYMGVTSSYINDPASVREAIGILRVFESSPQSLLDEDWKQLGQQVMPWTLLLASLGSDLDFRPLADNTRGLLQKFQESLEDYEVNDLASLLHKVVHHCFLVGGASLLSGQKLPDDLVKAYITFWQRAIGVLKNLQSFQESQLTELQPKLRIIASLRREFKGPLRTLQRVTTARAVKGEIQVAFEADDVIDAFFEKYARHLLANDFFLDPGHAPETSESLAKAYIELDKTTASQLWEGTFSGTRAPTLVQQLQFETEYDQIYILVIDGFSYLDWKLTKDWVSEELRKWLNPLEGYCFATLPTYTPCALTALLTGYAPQESGVWDWQVMLDTRELINLNEASESQCKAQVHVYVQPRNTMTLVHSYGNTGLSAILRMLTNVPMIDLPSASQAKAINKATQTIYEHPFETRVVAFYIADFDQFAHHYIFEDAWEQYYTMQAQRIVRNLVVPILRRAEEKSSKVLIVLTADHGKLTRYESRMLTKLLPDSGSFRKCAELVEPYLWRKSLRHLLGYIPEGDFERITDELEKGFGDKDDVQIHFGTKLGQHDTSGNATSLISPNFLIMSQYGVEGQAMGHGGASLSELIIPFIRLEYGGS